MKMNQVSTHSLNNSLRNITLDIQQKLATAQKELTTGKVEDFGLSLGGRTGSVALLQNQISQIDQLGKTNAIAAGRMETMQHSLNAMIDSGNSLNSTLAGQIGGSLDRGLIEDIASSTLSAVSSAVNVAIRGEFVFSGINSDAPALVDYEGTSGAAAKTAVQNAFTAHFGFTADDPAAAAIDAVAMETFLSGDFEDLFDDANWQNLWSGASENGMRSKTGLRELVQTPSTAYSQPYRSMVAGAVMMLEFSDSQLSGNAVDALAKRALETVSNATSGMAAEQGKIGVVEKQIENATERLSLQKNVIDTQLGEMTNVDPYEAANRLNNLVINLEASYAATARIQSLSLLNYF